MILCVIGEKRMRRRMGKRSRNGRISTVQETLHRRVEEAADQIMFSTADEIVNHLRSTYPDYQRTKRQVLLRLVQEQLQSLPNNGDRQKRCKTQVSEGHVSASESDADKGTPPSSKVSYDLTKTMLRDSYREKNFELDVGESKGTTATATDIVNESETKARKQLKGSVSIGNGSGGDVDVKGKDVTMFRDLGGMENVKEELNTLLLPTYHPYVARELGLHPTSGILFHGPPGCGKTRLAYAIANETGLPFYSISATQVVSGISGESEENIRDLFAKAYRTAPSIIFIDEIDAIASKRENLSREMEKRIVTQLLTCMDQPDNDNHILVIGATNMPDAIDPSLRRPGRFEREILIGRPDESSRLEILSVLTRNVKLEGPVDLQKIAKSTKAFTGSDLKSVIKHAGFMTMKRVIFERYPMGGKPTGNFFREPFSPEEVTKAAIKMCDLEEAVKMVQPSARREGFNALPNVKWEDIGGLDLLRHEFEDYIIRPIKYPEDYEGVGVDLSTGFLLYGPPGCGKTLIAKAVANAAGASFCHIKGPELLNPYVGVSEQNVRRMFNDARACAPCILFFDELDALATERGRDGREGGSVTDRVLNQLLIELDGADQRRDVFVIGATNRPDAIDPALLRPHRFGRLVYVPLPSPDQRVLIMRALSRKYRIDGNTDLSAIARSEACENMSGADLALLMDEAAMTMIRGKGTSTESIKTLHFEIALSRVFPSVSEKQKKFYECLSQRFSPSFHNEKERNGRK